MKPAARSARRLAAAAGLVLGAGLVLVAILLPRGPDADEPPDRPPAAQGGGTSPVPGDPDRLAERLALVRETLGADPDAVRALAADLLGPDLPERLARARLEIDLALSSAEPASAVAALEILTRAARLGGPATGEALATPAWRAAADRAVARPEAEVRAAAATLLGALGSDAGRAKLVPLLGDPSPDVRIAAVGAYARLAEHGGAARLAAVYGSEESPVVRSAVIRALAENPRLAGPEANAVVGAALAGGELPERLDALRFIASRREHSLAPAIAPLLADPDPTLRRAALETLLHLPDSRLRDAVLAAAAEERDPDLKELAERVAAGMR